MHIKSCKHSMLSCCLPSHLALSVAQNMTGQHRVRARLFSSLLSSFSRLLFACNTVVVTGVSLVAMVSLCCPCLNWACLMQIEPGEEHLLATACSDNSICIWDVRKLSQGGKPVSSVSHSLTCQSAYFAPDGTAPSAQALQSAEKKRHLFVVCAF